MNKSVQLLGMAMVVVTLTACDGGGGEAPPTSFPGLTVVDGAGYLASNQNVYKFDTATGKEVWRYPAIGQTFDASAAPGPFAGEPVRFGDQIIVGGAIPINGVPDGSIYAIADANGTVTWKWSVPSEGGKPRREFIDGVATDGKLLFAPNGNGTLYALDPGKLTGGQPTLVWEHSTGNKLWSRPLVANGVVYQASLDHHMTALDALTGKVLWTFKANASIASTPAIKDDVLFFGAFDSMFYALDAKTGTQKWATKIDAWVWNRPVVAADSVYFGDQKGTFYALSIGDGSVRFRSKIGDTLHGQPVVVDDSIYVVSADTFVYVISTNAQPDAAGMVPATRFSQTSGNRRLLSAPAIVGDKLLLPLFDGDVKLTAFQLSDKTKAFDLTLPTPTPAPAAK